MSETTVGPYNFPNEFGGGGISDDQQGMIYEGGSWWTVVDPNFDVNINDYITITFSGSGSNIGQVTEWYPNPENAYSESFWVPGFIRWNVMFIDPSTNLNGSRDVTGVMFTKNTEFVYVQPPAPPSGSIEPILPSIPNVLPNTSYSGDYKGDWVSGSYKKGNVVSYGEPVNFYISSIDNNELEPTVSGSNWLMLNK